MDKPRLDTTAGALAKALWRAKAKDLYPPRGVDYLDNGKVVYEGTEIPVRVVPESAPVTLVVEPGGGHVVDTQGGWIAERFGRLGVREVKRALKLLGSPMAKASNVVRRFLAYAETEDEFVTIRVVTRGEGHKAIKDIFDFLRKADGKSYERIRFFCENDKNLISANRPLEVSGLTQKKIPGDERYPEMESTFQVDNIGNDGLLRLILFLKWMGSAGSSREILVQEVGAEKPVHLTAFDGDGSDGITSLEVNDEAIEIGDGHGFNGLTG